MKIRFVKDAAPQWATDNENYPAGSVADLRRWKWLVDNGYAVPVDATPAPDAPNAPDDGHNYESMTVAMLRDELSIRGLPTSGRKADLIERLRG